MIKNKKLVIGSSLKKSMFCYKSSNKNYYSFCLFAISLNLSEGVNFSINGKKGRYITTFKIVIFNLYVSLYYYEKLI